MIPSRIRTLGPSSAQRPVALYVAAGAGALLLALGLWVVATMNTPPATTSVTAEVSINH